jgi:hypothetical protein
VRSTGGNAGLEEFRVPFTMLVPDDGFGIRTADNIRPITASRPEMPAASCQHIAVLPVRVVVVRIRVARPDPINQLRCDRISLN